MRGAWWTLFVGEVANWGQWFSLTFAVAVTYIGLQTAALPAVIEEATQWASAIQAFLYVCVIWAVICLIRAPFKVIADDKARGRWDGNHFVYHEPTQVAAERFQALDGQTEAREIRFRDAEPGSFVYFTLRAEPPVNGRILTFVSGGPPNPNLQIPAPVPNVITPAAPPGGYRGIRLPDDLRATLYVRLEPNTVPTIVRVYCNEFFVGKDGNG